MNKLQLFENPEFGKIRVVERNGEPWFVAADVCRALEIEESHVAMRRLDDDEKGRCSIPTLGGEQEMTVVNEPGLYALVLGSRKPDAKKFKRWITHDVLPSIRKHGAYMTEHTIDSLLENPDLIIELATKLKDERAERQRLEQENEIQKQTILDYEPKVAYYETILQSKELLAVSQIAADYGLSAKALNKILHEEGIQHRVGRQLVLYRKHMGKGYTKSVTHPFIRADGTPDSQIFTKWTQRGRLEIHRILESRGIKAIMDLEDEN